MNITTNVHNVNRVTVGKPEVMIVDPSRSLTTVTVEGFNDDGKQFSVCFFGFNGQIIKVEDER